MTDGACDPRHSEKTRGRYVNGVKLSPLWAGGPRCAILAAALCAHQISQRYLSHRWRVHIIYFQWLFVSQLVFEHTFELWLSMIDEKSLGNREPLRCVKRKQITKVSFENLDDSVEYKELLAQIFWIIRVQFPRDLSREEIVPSLNMKRANERIPIQEASGLRTVRENIRTVSNLVCRVLCGDLAKGIYNNIYNNDFASTFSTCTIKITLIF